VYTSFWDTLYIWNIKAVISMVKRI
jgi:hypothetical protein